MRALAAFDIVFGVYLRQSEAPMPIATLLVAAFAVLLVVAHGVGGEKTNIRRLRTATELSDADKLELRIVWHLFTWHLVLVTAGLWASSLGITVAQFLAVSLGGGGMLFFAFAARAGGRSLLRHPQWMALLVLGALIAWIGG